MGRKRAVVHAVAVYIFCPECISDDPIPHKDGSFMWGSIPETVVCPSCGVEFKVSKNITLDEDSRQ